MRILEFDFTKFQLWKNLIFDLTNFTALFLKEKFDFTKKNVDLTNLSNLTKATYMHNMHCICRLKKVLIFRKFNFAFITQCGKTIISHLKNISSNQLFSNLFSKTVTFTKFLPKMRERIPVISTLCVCDLTFFRFFGL